MKRFFLGFLFLLSFILKAEEKGIHLKATLEASRNRQALNDPAQNAYLFLKLIHHLIIIILKYLHYFLQFLKILI